MKKSTKIISMILCAVMLISVVVVAAFAETAAPTNGLLKETQNVGFSDKSSGLSKFTLTTSKVNPDFKFNLYSSKGYKATAEPFFNLGNNWDKDKIEGAMADAAISVHEFDIATASNYLPASYFRPESTIGGRLNSYGRLDADGTYHGLLDGKENIVKLGTKPYDWHHFVIMYDLKDSRMATYIDGMLADRGAWYTGEGAPQDIGSLRWNFLRALGEIEGGYTTCFANYNYRVFDSNSILTDFTAPEWDSSLPLNDPEVGVQAGDGLNYSPDFVKPAQENYYEVNGKQYTNFDVALTAANGGTIKILIDLPTITHNINKNVTIDPNRKIFKYEHVGFDMVKDESTGTLTFMETLSKTNIKFYDGDTLVEELNLPAGSAVVPTKIPASKVVDGKTLALMGFTEIKGSMDVLPEIPVAGENAIYYAVYKEALAVAKTKDGRVLTFKDGTCFGDILSQTPADSTITFYGDVEYKNLAVLNFTKNVTVDLNGHSLIMGTQYAVVKSSVKNMTFKNGKVVTWEGHPWFSMYEGEPTVTLENITLNAYSTYVDIRYGTLNIIGCHITSPKTVPKGYNIIQGGARGTKTVNLNFIDTVIDIENNFTHLYSSSRKTSGPEVGSGIHQFVNFKNCTVNGPLQTIVLVQNKKDGPQSSLRVTVDKDCVFNTNNPKFIVRDISDNICKVEDGFKSTTDIFGVDSSKVVLGNGTSVTLFDGKYYRVVPAVLEGNIFLNLDSDVNLVYIVDAGENATPKMKFTLCGQEFIVDGVKRHDGKFDFRFSNIDPRYFGETIGAELIADDGKTVAATYTVSVKDYCDKLLVKYADNVEIKNLASDILYYGAAAQVYTNYKTDALVTSGLKGVISKERAAEVVSVKNNIASANPEYAILSGGLKLGADVEMYFTVKATDINKVTLKVELNGEVITLDAKAFTENNGTFKVYFDGVDAYEFADAVKVTLAVEGKDVQTFTYSVNSYIASITATSTDKNLNALVGAIANYGESAKAYNAIISANK